MTGRLIDLGRGDAMAFEPRLGASHASLEDLKKFVSLEWRGIDRWEWRRDLLELADDIGPLLGGDAVPVPDGVAPMRGGKGAAEAVIEFERDWLVHSRALRDVAVLDSLSKDPKKLETVIGATEAADRTVTFDGSCMYLGSSSFADRTVPEGPKGLCSDEMTGWAGSVAPGSFAACLPFDGDGSLESRIEWLGENASFLARGYLSSYLSECRGAEGSLLASLQALLEDLVSSDQSFSFCTYCGRAIMPSSINKSHDLESCKYSLYKRKEALIDTLVGFGIDRGYAGNLLYRRGTR